LGASGAHQSWIVEKSHYKEKAMPEGHEHILVVEDEELLSVLIDTVLSDRGYKVLKAKDGAEAVNLYRTFDGDIDLVLTDLSLPEGDGWQVCRQIRSINPRVKLMVTTGAMDSRIENALKEQGIHGFIQKPCSADDMVEKIRTVLQRSS
jgi:DNA-binding response OmpR family regulator